MRRRSPALRRPALTEETFGAVGSFRTGSDNRYVLPQMDLQNTLMVDIQVQVGGDVPIEKLTNLPQRIGWTYTMHNSGGPPGAKTDFCYDAVSGSAF